MASFKRTSAINGKFKDIAIVNGKFVDTETGEEIDVIGILNNVFHGNTFTLSASYKADEDIE